MSTYSVRHLFPQLLSNGYVPIPNWDKACYLPKWSTILVDERQARLWTRQTRWPAIGLRVEAPLLVFDLDLPRDDIAKAVRDIMPVAARAGLERHGNPPKTAFFLRLRAGDEPFHILRTFRYAFADEPKRTFAVEIFGGGGGGAQVGSFGPHSHDEHGAVLKTYSWVNDHSPANVPLAALPEVGRAEAASFLDRVNVLLMGWPGLVRDVQSRAGEVAYEQVYELTDDMVFVDSEGFSYTLDELIAEAKARAELGQGELKVTGSFLGEDPTSRGSARCKVRWGKHTGLSITDFRDCKTWRYQNIPADPEINKMLGGVLAHVTFRED
jgi:hypothetical protein